MHDHKRRKFDNLQIINSPPKDQHDTDNKLLLHELPVGERVQLMPISGKVLYAQYIGYIPNESLMVTKPKSLEVYKDQVINVRILLQGNLYSFQSTVLGESKQPVPYLHLNFPSKIQSKAIREELRVSLSMDVIVGGKKEFANGKTSARAVLTDISNGGASIESLVQFGVSGDKVLMTATFKVDGAEKRLAIPCLICQVRGWEDIKTRELTLLHGIKFELSDIEDKDFIESYVAQQIRYAKTCKII